MNASGGIYYMQPGCNVVFYWSTCIVVMCEPTMCNPTSSYITSLWPGQGYHRPPHDLQIDAEYSSLSNTLGQYLIKMPCFSPVATSYILLLILVVYQANLRSDMAAFHWKVIICGLKPIA